MDVNIDSGDFHVSRLSAVLNLFHDKTFMKHHVELRIILHILQKWIHQYDLNDTMLFQNRIVMKWIDYLFFMKTKYLILLD